jgi:sulfite exporter TauE/SafE
MIFVAAFILGLSNSLHCLGMCGPLHLAANSATQSSKISFAHAGMYHAGRIFTYAMLGLMFGILGIGLKLTGIQQNVSIIGGFIIILFVLAGYNKIELKLFGPYKKLFGSALARFHQQKTIYTKLGAGIINGFLPCGLVYIAIIGSLVMDEAWQSAMFMILFGLGTLPVFTILTALPTKVLKHASFKNISSIAGIILGILLIIRGLGLGIPYISPNMPATNSTTESCAPHE